MEGDAAKNAKVLDTPGSVAKRWRSGGWVVGWQRVSEKGCEGGIPGDPVRVGTKTE